MREYDIWRQSFMGDRVFNDIHDLPEYVLRYLYDSIEEHLTPVLECDPESCDKCEAQHAVQYDLGYINALNEAEGEMSVAIANILWRMRNKS